MLELIELEARARAIRSQLALEPVTKIELDDSDDEKEQESPITGLLRPNVQQSSQSKSLVTSKKSVQDSKQSSKKSSAEQARKLHINKKSSQPQKKSLTSSNDKTRESPSPKTHPPSSVSSKRIVVHKLTEKSSELITLPKSKPVSVPPVKLKRNFIKTPSETSTTTESLKKDGDFEIKQEMMTASRSSSPDIIRMEQNIATYFISDSDDEEPPSKIKLPEKSRNIKESQQTEMGISSQENQTISNDTNLKSFQLIQKSNESIQLDERSQKKTTGQQNESELDEILGEDDNGDVVNLMSDTEIELNINSDKEDDIKEPVKTSEVVEERKRNKNVNNSTNEETNQVEIPNDNYDDDVVEIHSDCELDGEKPIDNAKPLDESETWQQRYLQSSTVKNVLKTTKLASKVRVKLAADKKTQEELKRAKKVEEKAEIDKKKERTEKISQLEEGSLEQFQGLKDTNV